MRLTRDEIARFDEDGYLFFPECFTAEEAAVLKAAANEVYAMEREEVWRESSGVARTAFAAHTYNEAHRRLGRHPQHLQDRGPVKVEIELGAVEQQEVGPEGEVEGTVGDMRDDLRGFELLGRRDQLDVDPAETQLLERRPVGAASAHYDFATVQIQWRVQPVLIATRYEELRDEVVRP